MRLAIAAGGTGGHIFPAVALIEGLLARKDSAALVFGRSTGMERNILGNRHDIEYVGLQIRPFLRSRLTVWPIALAELVQSVFFACRTLRQWKPDAVLGMGGYVSAPVVMAALLTRLPVAVADQNALPGRANRFLGRFATRVFCGCEESLPFFSKRKRRLTGIPLRVGATMACERPPFETFGLKQGLFTLLVFGGSQGALALCEAVRQMLPVLDQHGVPYQILLQVGARNSEWIENAQMPNHVKTVEMIEDMSAAYACADAVVCRAGAVSLAEMAVQGKPAILIPYPFAKDDHQTKNAKAWGDVGAARVIEQSLLTPESL
ncbi:MAG TPA: undecaprenyldiphospho-muramoylpentapeptide beta-N-acetylglucosaminyltransferase, partial [bacterium]|nr:undecaprenyldiphospho-muramoylpentapeptide beta-N-acetylglucosaminyltransferase [bacterium]